MKTEREIIHDRIRATAKALFDGVKAAFVYRVSLSGEDFPELEIPADHETQAKARFDACCAIRFTNKTHQVDVVEQATAAGPRPLQSVELMEAPKNEHQRRRRNGSGEARGGEPVA